ncbi:phasin family protein [Rhodobacteraceae bacterium KMM 6894]|nr:phasin family protein [Rhodobacteraceae bacterium KMM 6894]
MKKSISKEETAQAGVAAFAGVPGVAEWLNIMTQSAQFVADRLQQDMETQRAFLQCRTPQDVMQLHTEFYKTAIAQYTAEATRMMQAVSEATAETAMQATKPTSRTYDDVPL